MATPIYDTSAPVLVTGATGYVAGWLVRRLLEEGFTVHAAVRNPDDARRTAHLTEAANALPGTLMLFKADLLEDGSYGPAMAGCRVVFHTASPFTSRITDPQRDLVDPALKGTRNVLASVNATPCVERVVLTSSCAAIYGDNADLAKASGGVLTENDWNTTSTLDHQPYAYSKTVAERAAWDLADAQSRWRLTVINPSLVLGPGLSGGQTSESFNLIRQITDGTMKTGLPKLEIGAVDVRDVAEAHIRAGFVPEASGRHIVSADTVSFLEIAQVLRRKAGNGWKISTRELPKWLVWLVGPMANKMLSRKMIANNMGIPWNADNTRSKTDLGLNYHSLDTAIEEMFQQMLDSGQVKA